MFCSQMPTFSPNTVILLSLILKSHKCGEALETFQEQMVIATRLHSLQGPLLPGPSARISPLALAPWTCDTWLAMHLLYFLLLFREEWEIQEFFQGKRLNYVIGY